MTESSKAEMDGTDNQRKTKQFWQRFTLIALFLFWIGYVFALYNENTKKISSYSLLIVAFSLVNFNALCGVEKIENKAFNLLAKLDGVLFFVWVVVTIVSTILK